LTKSKFHLNVKRISVKAKVTYLLQKSKELIKTIKHEYYLREMLNKIQIVSLLADNITVFRHIAFILVIIFFYLFKIIFLSIKAIVINFLVLFSFEYSKETITDDQGNSIEIYPDAPVDKSILFFNYKEFIFFL
jgi:hypothetical protein